MLCHSHTWQLADGVSVCAAALAGVPLCFAEVEEAVRLTRQTALGYIRGRHSKSGNCSLAKNKQAAAGQRKVVLGPAASHTVVFEEHDRIVVLAADFNVTGAASSNGQ